MVVIVAVEEVLEEALSSFHTSLAGYFYVGATRNGSIVTSCIFRSGRVGEHFLAPILKPIRRTRGTTDAVLVYCRFVRHTAYLV